MAKDSSSDLSFEGGTLDGRNSDGGVGPIGDAGRVNGGDDKAATYDLHCHRRPGIIVSSCVQFLYPLRLLTTALGIADIGGRDQVPAAPLLHGDGPAHQRHQRPPDHSLEAEDARMPNGPRKPLPQGW